MGASGLHARGSRFPEAHEILASIAPPPDGEPFQQLLKPAFWPAVLEHLSRHRSLDPAILDACFRQRILGADHRSNAVFIPGYESVSLDSLLRMRGGLAPNATDWWAFRNYEIERRRYWTLRTNMERRPEVAPGTFQYSNLSYMVAGAMAERMTGKPWEELMIERVFVPLGM